MRALPHGTVADALATVRTSGALVTTKDEMMRAIRGHPNRGLRDLSSTMARMSDSLGPFGPGLVLAPFAVDQAACLRADGE